MAIFYPFKVQCSCGNAITVQLARTVNIGRSPEIKQKILDGVFHKCHCPKCGLTVTVEKEFSYVDFTKNTFIKVKPRQERYFWKNASAELLSEVDKIPGGLIEKKDLFIRVVYGISELRDKIVALDYNLDDRLLEVLKVLLIYEHPVLTDKPRLKIAVDQIYADSITFIAAYELDNYKKYKLSLPRWIVDQLIAEPEKVIEWLAKSHKINNIFQLANDFWVSIQRWSPQVAALDSLRNFAEGLSHGLDINTASIEFKNMIEYLPKGSQLPAWAKQDIRTLFLYAKNNGQDSIEQQLFSIRFDKKLNDEWALNNDPNDMDTIYKLLLNLPETNVEGNVFLDEILLDAGQASGMYNPSTKDIYISPAILSYQEFFEDTVRHEVGHAVHENNKLLVDAWLLQRFGWQDFSIDSSSVNEWVNLMGGWGGIDILAQNQIVTYLASALGAGGSWYPGTIPAIPADHPWRNADFGPRLAFENTNAYWYSNFGNWYRFNGKAFFLNYWYQRFYCVDIATLDLIALMPSSYASMSHYEFFAELYSLYYDGDDPLRPVIPADITLWLDNNIGRMNNVQQLMPGLSPEKFNWQKK